MKTQLRRATTGLVAGAVVVAGAALAAAPANAASIGTLSFSPATGDATSLTAYTASGACPAADTVKVTVVGGSGTGAVLATPKNIVGTQSQILNGQGNVTVAAFQDWTTFAQTNGLTNLNGAYNVAIACSSGSSFDGVLTFTGTALANATYVATSVTPIATTTTLSGVPASPINFGTSATVTATVAATGGGTPTGSVQFKVDGANSGSPVALAGGSATFSTPTSLAAGPHTVSAVYAPDATGTASGFQTSTSATGNFSINKVTPTVSLTATPQTPTSGTCAAGAICADQGTVVALAATVSPSSLAGTVNFYDGATLLNASPVSVSAGTATYSWTVPPTATVGAHSLSAQFNPADTVNVATPAPATATLTVNGASVPILTTGNTITVTVPVGTLSVTTPAAMTLTFGTPYLSSNGKYFVATGGVQPIVISDTRAGDFGWHVDVAATDFVGTKGGPSFATGPYYNNKYPWQQNVINAANLGFVDDFLTAPVALPSPNLTTTLNTGDVLVPVSEANGLTPSGGSGRIAGAAGFTTSPLLPGVSSTTGLGSARRIINATGGQGIGSATGDAEFSGHFQLNIPTVTIADTYVSTLTYTVTGN